MKPTFSLSLQVLFDADESERMHDSFTALSHARMMQLRGQGGHGGHDGCHRLQAAQQPPMRPSIPPPPPTTTTGMMPSPPLTPQPVHRRRPASPFRMSQG